MDPSQQEDKFRVRPRFKVQASLSIESLVEQIGTALKRDDSKCRGHVHVLGGTITLPEDQRHYWSPQLSVRLRRNPRTFTNHAIGREKHGEEVSGHTVHGILIYI